ncbi:Myb family transcription factor EFM-like [Canna indica]|uniref:Myb family transcription factor EFM-like n=1 Tax=Canna indica TaxID=4628 RepID=A0AAQ3JZB9_9LILI|nr:Myb family transcription factor EFM-like [Canna indica]
MVENMAMVDNQLDQAWRCHEYIGALEEERKKIEVFQRELPLCLQLITQAIESVKGQLMSVDGSVNNGPAVAEEFIPLRPSPTRTTTEEGEGRTGARKSPPPADAKPDWLRSAQLWNEEHISVERPKKPIAVNLKTIGGAFQPYERERYIAPSSNIGSSSGGGGQGEKEKKEGVVQSQPPHRKARRSWSPELHRRFIETLHKLGGSHVATPKQIRELMKKDGLTCDEIKSHLQKYRLHNIKSSPTASQRNIRNICPPPRPQFVLIGGILVQPPDHTAADMAAAAPPGNSACTAPTAIYAPVMSLLPQDLRFQQQWHINNKIKARQEEEEKRNHDGDNNDGTNSASPAISTTTLSSN